MKHERKVQNTKTVVTTLGLSRDSLGPAPEFLVRLGGVVGEKTPKSRFDEILVSDVDKFSSMITMKNENLRKTLLCEVSQCVRDAGVLAKVFGVSERSRCVLIGTSAPNIANISSHHVIFSTFHQLALFFWRTSDLERSWCGAGQKRWQKRAGPADNARMAPARPTAQSCPQKRKASSAGQ